MSKPIDDFELLMEISFPRITLQGKAALAHVLVMGPSTAQEAANLFKVSRQSIQKNYKRYMEKYAAVQEIRSWE